MNCETRATSVSILLSIIVCFISLTTVKAQQAVSLHFGASASRPDSAAGASAPVRGSGSGGGSSWGAGKGGFGYSAKPGGVWRDGSTLSAAPGVAPSTTQVRTPAVGALSAGGDLAAGSLSPKGTSVQGNPASSTAHFPRSSSGRGSVSKSSGMGHAAGGSRGRVGSSGLGTGRGETRQSSGLTTSITQHRLTEGSSARSSLHSGLDTGLSK